LQALTDAAYQADQDNTTREDNKAAKENVADNNVAGGDEEMADGDKEIAGGGGQKIKVTVQAQGRADIVFEVSSDKKILKLMTAYAKANVRIILNVGIHSNLN
jgi:hypothetical protein